MCVCGGGVNGIWSCYLFVILMYLGNFIIVFICDIGLCDNLFHLCFLIVNIFCLILARKE